MLAFQFIAAVVGMIRLVVILLLIIRVFGHPFMNDINEVLCNQ